MSAVSTSRAPGTASSGSDRSHRSWTSSVRRTSCRCYTRRTRPSTVPGAGCDSGTSGRTSLRTMGTAATMSRRPAVVAAQKSRAARSSEVAPELAHRLRPWEMPSIRCPYASAAARCRCDQILSTSWFKLTAGPVLPTWCQLRGAPERRPLACCLCRSGSWRRPLLLVPQFTKPLEAALDLGEHVLRGQSVHFRPQRLVLAEFIYSAKD